MAKYTLNYVNARGRAEPVRLLFALAGQEFTDLRFEFSEWPAIKPNAPFGQMPFMEVTEGDKTHTISQSITMARFVAKRFGLAGKDEYEQVYVDMYADQLTDLLNEYAKGYFEKDEAKKKELSDKLNNETVPNNLKFFEKRLSENNGHIVSSGLTYADLYFYALLEKLVEKPDSTLESFPAVKALIDEIKNHPRIAAYLAKRPVTEH